MSGCIFCRIVAGEIPAGKVYEDETSWPSRTSTGAPVHVW